MSTRTSSLRPLWLALPALIALVMGIAVGVYWLGDETDKLQSATVLDTPRPIPALQLVSGDGSVFGPAQLRGQWHVLFFGFTHCPDICPNTLALLDQASSRMAQRGQVPRVVFISVDPGRDSPAELAEYVHYFNSDFTGVTGPLGQIRKLTDALYLPFSYQGDTGSDNYQVDHSAALILVNPQAQAVAYLTPPHRVEQLASDMHRIIHSRENG